MYKLIPFFSLWFHHWKKAEYEGFLNALQVFRGEHNWNIVFLTEVLLSHPLLPHAVVFIIRELHLSHIQSMQGYLELCFRYLKFTRPTLHLCIAGFCPRDMQPFYFFSALSTDGLMELWRYSSNWHATQREVVLKQTIALQAKVIFTTWVCNFNCLPEFGIWREKKKKKTSHTRRREQLLFHTKAQCETKPMFLQAEEVTEGQNTQRASVWVCKLDPRDIV